MGTPGAGLEKAARKAMEAVAKHMRYNVPTKSALIKGEKVEYFPGIESDLIAMVTKSFWYLCVCRFQSGGYFDELKVDK